MRTTGERRFAAHAARLPEDIVYSAGGLSISRCMLQPGDQEICGGFRHFRADALDVLLGHFMNGLRFHLVKFAHSAPFRVHNNDLVSKSLLTQQNCGQRNSYADNFTGRIAVLVGEGQHVFNQVGVEIDLHFGSTVFYWKIRKNVGVRVCTIRTVDFSQANATSGQGDPHPECECAANKGTVALPANKSPIAGTRRKGRRPVDRPTIVDRFEAVDTLYFL